MFKCARSSSPSDRERGPTILTVEMLVSSWTWKIWKGRRGTGRSSYSVCRRSMTWRRQEGSQSPNLDPTDNLWLDFHRWSTKELGQFIKGRRLKVTKYWHPEGEHQPLQPLLCINQVILWHKKLFSRFILWKTDKLNWPWDICKTSISQTQQAAVLWKVLHLVVRPSSIHQGQFYHTYVGQWMHQSELMSKQCKPLNAAALLSWWSFMRTGSHLRFRISFCFPFGHFRLQLWKKNNWLLFV